MKWKKYFMHKGSQHCNIRNKYKKYAKTQKKKMTKKASRKWMDQFLIGKTSYDKDINLKANIILIKILIGSLMEPDQLKWAKINLPTFWEKKEKWRQFILSAIKHTVKFHYLKQCNLSSEIHKYTNGTNRKSENRLLNMRNFVYIIKVAFQTMRKEWIFNMVLEK